MHFVERVEVRNQLGPALQRQLGERSQQWLADRLGEMGVRGATQTQVSRWIKQIDGIRPEQVFAIERALGVEPGTLSRLEGYVPAETVPVIDLRDAIDADPKLGPHGKDALRMLVDYYRQTGE